MVASAEAKAVPVAKEEEVPAPAKKKKKVLKRPSAVERTKKEPSDEAGTSP